MLTTLNLVLMGATRGREDAQTPSAPPVKTAELSHENGFRSLACATLSRTGGIVKRARPGCLTGRVA